MRRANNAFSTLRWISVIFIIAAVVLTAFQLISYSRDRANFPAGTIIANIPVGNLDRAEAANRILVTYSSPIELRYNNAVIQTKPNAIGFSIDLEGMLTAADLQRVARPFWAGFWDYLWNRQRATADIPLRATLDQERARSYLVNEIAARYDEPPSPPVPIPGTTNFTSGKAGSVLNVDSAIELIDAALKSPTNRIVNLSFNNTAAPRPALRNLQILLQQIFQVNDFDGIADVYLQDLQSNESIHFGYQNGSTLPVDPDIAFSAESSIKIPIMVSVFRRTDEPTPPTIINAMSLMIQESGNAPADTLMDLTLSPGIGPLEVTQDMQMLGLENTFLGAYMARPDFLSRNQTPANMRTDIQTNPDPFSQTTPLDMGTILEDIYLCSQNGGGAFAAAFPDLITQGECQQMISLLAGNKTVAILLQAGLPEGTQIAHKHAYATESDGLIHTMGDSGIVYTPGGNYIISVFLYDPVQMVFDPANRLVAELSEAVYNYFNIKQ